MGTQDYRETYLTALEEANSHLDEIFQEYEQLQLRKEQIEDVLMALKPFVPSISAVSQEAQRPESVRVESVRVEPEIPAPVAAAAPVHEPVAPAPFAPVPDIIVDPIQSRINRALGLAVA
jgi:hypothetical protein